MNEPSMKRHQVLDALSRALDDWVCRGNEQPLTRWLGRELDPRGALVRLPISDWHDCLERLLRARPPDGTWPRKWDEPISMLVQASVWFSRRDGSPVTTFDAPKSPPFAGASVLDLAKSWQHQHRAQKSRNGSLTRKQDEHRNDRAGLAWGGSKQVLDVLRPGWPAEDDFLAIDHRDAGSSCRFELFGAGRSWLGPCWMTGVDTKDVSTPRPRSWVSGSAGSLAEWSYRAGEARITQSALILGGRSLALLSMLKERGPSQDPTAGLSLALAPGITATPLENSRALVLGPSGKRPSAQVLPIGLPSLSYPTERGAFLTRDDALVLTQASYGRRSWLPLLVSWDSQRHRKVLHWRILSVSEKSRNVPPDRAFAVRVSWGRDESYVIYRSLAKPALRAFLGHQTRARFLVGRFTRDGVVEPLLKVE